MKVGKITQLTEKVVNYDVTPLLNEIKIINEKLKDIEIKLMWLQIDLEKAQGKYES